MLDDDGADALKPLLDEGWTYHERESGSQSVAHSFRSARLGARETDRPQARGIPGEAAWR